MKRLGRHAERLKELRREIRSRRPGEVVVDGRRLGEDLVRWGVPIRELFLAESLAAEAAGWAVTASAAAVWVVPDRVLESLAPTRHPQGVLAIVGEPVLPAWDRCDGVGLYLDRVQDPGNVGAIARAAAGLGARAVLLSHGCADPFSAAAVRGSAGAVFRISVERDAVADREAIRVRGRGGEVWASGAEGVPVTSWRPGRPLLLLLGAEGSGVDPDLVARADGTVTVPLERQIESLNVAVAAGILLHELCRS